MGNRAGSSPAFDTKQCKKPVLMKHRFFARRTTAYYGNKESGMKQNALQFLEQLLHRMEKDDVSAVGAQMSYYLILAFFPFLIFLVAIVTHTAVTSEQILMNLSRVLATDTYELVRDFMNDSLRARSSTGLSVGMIGTLWAASLGVTALINGLNKAYDQNERRPYWLVRAIAFVFTLALGLVIVVSFTLLVFGEAIGTQLFKLLGYPENFTRMWTFVKFGVPLLIIFVVFSAIYQIVPNRRQSIRDVIPGAAFATVGWIITSILFAFYVNNFGNYTKVYGSIGGIIVLLIWIYFSSMIIMVGGEINATLTNMKKGIYETEIKKFCWTWPFYK